MIQIQLLIRNNWNSFFLLEDISAETKKQKVFLPTEKTCLSLIKEKNALAPLNNILLNFEGLFYFVGAFLQILFIVLSTWQKFTRAV